MSNYAQRQLDLRGAASCLGYCRVVARLEPAPSRSRSRQRLNR